MDLNIDQMCLNIGQQLNLIVKYLKGGSRVPLRRLYLIVKYSLKRGITVPLPVPNKIRPRYLLIKHMLRSLYLPRW